MRWKLFVLVSSVFGAFSYAADTGITLDSVQRRCVAQLADPSKWEGGISMKVVSEAATHQVRVHDLSFEEVPDTLYHRWVSLPFMRFIVNGNLQRDDLDHFTRETSEFSFHELLLVPRDDGTVTATLRAERTIPDAEFPIGYAVQATLTFHFVEGDWSKFMRGRRCVLEASERGRCALSRVIGGNGNGLIPLLSPQARRLLTGQCGFELPLDLEYTDRSPLPRLVGTARALSFEGLSLEETLTVRLHPGVTGPDGWPR